MCLVIAGHRLDVTLRNVVAALRPLTIAIGLDDAPARILRERETSTLEFIDRRSGVTVGSLTLKLIAEVRESSAKLNFFEIVGDTQRCLMWPHRPWNRWMQNRASRLNREPGNFTMPPEIVQQTMVFYMCPRPVVAVSVDDGKHSNIFPMDLIGGVATDRFTLALRSTSPSVQTMRLTRTIALSDIPAEHVKTAYALGAHHKQIQINLLSLPFGIERSTEFALPVPDFALRIREIEILSNQAIGSHTFFTGRIVSEVIRRTGAQLCHISGTYLHYRTRIGHPLHIATQD